MIKIGSCFAGIGGFDLGIETAIPNSRTVWQIEQDEYCQRILNKHWPDAVLYDDIRTVEPSKMIKPDIILAGFPCQDISCANRVGAGKGVNDGEKSSLWWEAFRLISEMRPSIICLENVPAINKRGLGSVVAALASEGYDSEWSIISASGHVGAPHKRNRWFLVGYPRGMQGDGRCITDTDSRRIGAPTPIQARWATAHAYASEGISQYWKDNKAPSPFCSVDDGIPERVARLKALGNAIVPQCAEYLGRLIVNSGLIEKCGLK